ncbi:MAG: DNA-processing protein DprA, partial [Bacteroidales bacterium]|nr:DNA-processing protein DprA [Bacteroidales bacterium]
MNENLNYKIALGMISGIGNMNAKKLIAYIGSVEGIFKEKRQNLEKIPGIGTKLSLEISNSNALNEAEQEISFINKNNIEAIFFTEKTYPERLKHCEDSPIIIYKKGKFDLNKTKILSIVGTRNASQYGKDNCNKLITDLFESGHNPLIVSGLAYGVDICAHKAAIKNNLATVAVLGHGLDIIYPAAHKNYAKEILQNGALLSEFSSNSKLDPSNFVKRNRIIAGMSDATIVVESAKKGGSLITAELANSYNRDVFAFPGRINDKFSEGCNLLIKTNRAALIESYKDIEYILGWEKKDKKAVQGKLFIE